MQSKVIWSFLSVVALSAGALVSACDSDATIAKSGVGESCDSAADCEDGLNCIQGACYEGSPDPGGEGGSDDPGVGPLPPVLGGEGESCTRAADCEEGLGCYNNRCIAEPTGEGGGGNDPIRLGQLGETCRVSSDCESTLVCLPGGLNQVGPIGYLGVCSKGGGELVPSGKSCSAECVEDTDCCELPVALHVPYAVTDTPGTSGPYGTGANSCAELAELITTGAIDCDAVTPATAAAALCFAQAAYCDCNDTWTCEAGRCNYTAECSEDGATPGGCPHYTRSGMATPTVTCDAKTDTCQPPVGKPICTRDADCDTLNTTDAPNEPCAKGECVCYEERGCYRRCDGPLDCAPGFTCDEAVNVCKAVPACTTNAECQVTAGQKFGCNDGACQQTCATHFDCNGGVVSGVNTQVCNPDGFCEMVGCTIDEQCTNGAEINPVKMFCVDNVTPADGAVASAITD